MQLRTKTTKPTNPPLPSELTRAVRLATTSIEYTAPPVNTYHKIVTGTNAKNNAT